MTDGPAHTTTSADAVGGSEREGVSLRVVAARQRARDRMMQQGKLRSLRLLVASVVVLISVFGKPAPGYHGKPLVISVALVVVLVAIFLVRATVARRQNRPTTPAEGGAHINRIFAKTGVRDRAQAVGYAYRAGRSHPTG